MPTFEITSPDGRKFRVTAPEGASQADVMAYAKQSMPAPEKYDPTEGMSGLEKFGAGVGKAMVDTGRGLGQLVGLVPQSDIDEAKRLDAPLMDTGAGLAGDVVGNVASLVGPGAAVGALGKASRLPALVNATRALLAPKTIPGAALAGGTLGALQPVASDDSRAKNVIVGGVGGAVLPALLAGGNVAGSLVRPFTRGGQEKIAGQALQRFAADPAAIDRAGPGLVPGSQPTLAEATGDIGLAQLQRTLRNNPDTNTKITQRLQDNAAARVEALRQIAGDERTRSAAETARAQATAPLYEQAFQAQPRRTPELGARVADLEGRPAFRDAMQKGIELAKNEGVDVAVPAASRAARSVAIDPAKDDIVTAVRKLGGISPADERIGSLAQMMPFGGHPAHGPVWRSQAFGGAANRTNTTAGHSVEEMTRKLYEHGYVSERGAMDEVLDKLMDSSTGAGQHFSAFREPPSSDPLANAVEALTKQLAEKNKPAGPSVDFVGSGAKLGHYTKKALDDKISAAVRADKDQEAHALMSVRDALLGTLEHPDFAPAYGAAREKFAELSRPINQMDIGQRLLDTLQPALADHGAPRQAAGAYAKALRDGDATARRATGFPGARMDAVMDPAQLQTLQDIAQELGRSARASEIGSGRGSPTAQNLISQDMLRNVLGPMGLPGGWADTDLLRSAMRPISFAYKMPEQSIMNLLGDAALDPKLAKELADKARKNPAFARSLAGMLQYAPLPAASGALGLAQ